MFVRLNAMGLITEPPFRLTPAGWEAYKNVK